jgi:hypothetical protein
VRARGEEAPGEGPTPQAGLLAAELRAR